MGKTTRLRYLKDEYIDVPKEVVTILNELFMEGGRAYRSAGWRKRYRGYVGAHSDWEHAIATAYLKLKTTPSKQTKSRANKEKEQIRGYWGEAGW